MTNHAPAGIRGHWLFTATFVCSALTTLALVAFFFIGVADGSVSSFNITLWLAMLGVAGSSLWAGHALRSKGRTGLAFVALSVTAVPGLLAAFFLLLLLVTETRWN